MGIALTGTDSGIALTGTDSEFHSLERTLGLYSLEQTWEFHSLECSVRCSCVELSYKGTGDKSPKKVIFDSQTEIQVVTGEAQFNEI